MKYWTSFTLIASAILLIWPISEYANIVVGILAGTLGLWTLFGKNS